MTTQAQSKTFSKYVRDLVEAYEKDQGISPSDDVFTEMAQAVIDSGRWRNQGFLPAEVQTFARAFGLRFR